MDNIKADLIILKEVRAAIDMLTKELSTAYFGCLLSKLKVNVDHSMGAEFSVSPDGALNVNPNAPCFYMDNKSRLCRDLIHEAGHIAFEHFERKKELGVSNGNHNNFNIAADCAIEHVLDESYPWLKGDPKHHEALDQSIPRSLWGTEDAEGLYQTIMTTDTDEPDADDAASHIPELSPLGESVIRQAKEEAMAEFVEQAKESSPKNTERQPKGDGRSEVPQAVKDALRLDNKLDFPKTSLDVIKKEFVKSYGRGDEIDEGTFNQSRLIRREYLGLAMMGRKQPVTPDTEGDIKGWHNDLTLYADVSGSMSISSVKASFMFAYRLAKEFGVFPIHVITYNTSVCQTFEILPSTNIQDLNIYTGGSTNVNRVLENCPPKSKLTLILTDMQDSAVKTWDYPGKPLWLIHDNYSTEFPQFIGKKIFINDII